MEDYWSKLDNAGKIYPAVISAKNTTLFRISVVLKEQVDPEILQTALAGIISRFPYFDVFLKKGLYWYYFKKASGTPIISEDVYYPCTQYRFKKKSRFFSVKYSTRTISVEFSHAITDGTGAMDFTRALLYEYLIQLGVSVEDAGGIKVSGEEVDPEEYSDGFKMFHDIHLPPGTKPKTKAFHLRDKLLPPGEYRFMTVSMDFKSIREAAAGKELSVTGYICFLYMKILQEIMFERKKKLHPIRINIPVNLRNIFPSRTMFNFFIPITPSIDPRIGYFSDEDIIKHIRAFMSMEIDQRYIGQMIRRNIRAEKNIFIRTIPLVLKELILPLIYNSWGERGYTSGISNLGKVSFPPEMEEKIESVNLIPPPSPGNLAKMICLSYKGRFFITFGSIAAERTLESRFFDLLRKTGIRIKYESGC